MLPPFLPCLERPGGATGNACKPFLRRRQMRRCCVIVRKPLVTRAESVCVSSQSTQGAKPGAKPGSASALFLGG